MGKTSSLMAGLLSIFLLAGCGGGGGGGGSASPYTGLTSQASLTPDNVVDITTQAYQAGDRTVSAATVTPLGEPGPGPSEAGDSRAVSLVWMLRDVVENVEMPPVSPSRPLSATGVVPMVEVTESATISDGFGGTASYTLTMNTETGYFHGTFTFSSWHGDADSTISGTTSVEGQFNETGEINSIQFTFHAVTMVDGADSVTITGTVNLSMTSLSGTASVTATVEIYLGDNVAGKTVWLHEYTVTVTEGPDESPGNGIPDYTDVSVSGRIYLHDYGCVDVFTPMPFRVYDGSANPASGVFRIEGSEERSAQLVVIDEATGYYVEADLNGDGTYEWTSITYPWP